MADGLKGLQKPKKFAQKAVKSMERRGTVGSLTRIAEKAGESPMEFANSHLHDPDTRIRRKALFAHNINERNK